MTKPHLTLHNPIEIHFDSVSRYHYFLFTVLFLSHIPILWNLMSLLFLTPPIDFYCDDSGENGHNSSKNVCPCANPKWDRNVFTETLQTKYGLYCEKQWLIEFSHSLQYFGALLGSLIFGFLSDKLGRLATCSISFFTTAFFGSLQTLMPNLAGSIVTRALHGASVGGAVVCTYVLCVEYCGVRLREVVSALLHIPLNIGHTTLPGVSYLLRHCDHFQLGIAIPTFSFVSIYWCLLESPKWLMDSGQIDEAASVMEKIGKFNKTSYGEIKTEMEEYKNHHKMIAQEKMQFWQLFQHRRLITNFVCMAGNYFVCGMGYYGVSQYIGRMSGNIHANVAVSGALLMPGSVAAIYLLHVLNRRAFLMATNFISGALMLIVAFIPPDKMWARVIIACVCNSGFFVSFMIVFLYGAELFPTPVRSSVMGVLTVMSRAAKLIVPPLMTHVPQNILACIFGGFALIGGLLCLPLPETKNTELPSSFEDSENLPRASIETILSFS